MLYIKTEAVLKYCYPPTLASRSQHQARGILHHCSSGLSVMFVISLLLILPMTIHADIYYSPDTQLTGKTQQKNDDSFNTYQGYTTSNFDTLRSVSKPLHRDVDRISLTTGDAFISLGASAGIDMDIDTFTTESPPHLRVDFLVQTLENLAVNNGGAIQDMRINWSAHSPIATDEPKFKPDSWIPPPGNSLQFNDPPIYIGLVTNGCGNVATFPITFYSEVYNGGNIFGSFNATDNNTIQPNGYWNFSYTIRVSDNNGNQSDIRIKGIVRALCE